MATVKKFYASVYDSTSIWSLRLAHKKCFITEKAVHLKIAGPPLWLFILAIGPLFAFEGIIRIFILAFAGAIFFWLILAWLSEGKDLIIPIKNIKKVEIDHLPFTLLYRVKLTQKDGTEYYFQPYRSFWSRPDRRFAEEIVKQIRDFKNGKSK